MEIKKIDMKKTINIIVILLVLTSIITMQSCKKESPLTPVALLAAMPKTPVPATGTVIAFTAANQTVNLSWEGTATNTIKWDVYFGTSSTPPLVASNVTGNSYAAHIGTTGGVYYWQVQTIDANNIPSASAIWNFDVNSNPATPVLTTPANAATAVSTTVALVWTCTDPESDALTFDVYLGTTATPGVAASGIAVKTYSPTLAYNTTYYWKIIAHDSHGGVSAASAVNSFKTDVFKPDFSVFKGIFSELCPNTSATRLIDVFLSVNTTTHVITMYLPIADAMVAAGWGNQYSGPHPIYITYDPATFAVTSTKQLLEDSFPDPIEQGPMYLQVSSGTIDATAKTLSIKWIITPSTAEFGGVVTTSATTYTLRVQK